MDDKEAGASRTVSSQAGAWEQVFVSTSARGPIGESPDRAVGEQRLDRVVMASEVFLARNQVVYRFVTIAADVDGLAHLLTCVAFLEPLVRVAGAGNQVVFGRSQLWFATAKGARRDL
jgi:hypothetical protein